MLKKWSCLLNFFFYYCIVSSKSESDVDDLLPTELEKICPAVKPKLFKSSVLQGGKEAGQYIAVNATDLASCTNACCQRNTCHVALLHDKYCTIVDCKTVEDCQIIQGQGTSAVVLRTVNNTTKVSQNETNIKDQKENAVDLTPNLKTVDKGFENKRCEVGLLECEKNEKCIPLGNRRKNGLCQCNNDFHRDVSTGECIKNDTGTSQSSKEITSASVNELNKSTSTVLPGSSSVNILVTPIPSKSLPKPVEKLVVSVNNKTVYLTTGSTTYEERITLSAYAIGDISDIKYEWTLIEKPSTDNGGSISDANSQTITLSHLVQGVYIFKVTVDAPGAHGEAVGNVTVLPPKRINQPPKAVITPTSQEIKLPNSGVIIDGSGSTDDGGIVSYHWEIVTAPLGYKLSEETGQTLHLTDLLPGNYTIMLLVKDKEGLEGNTTTFVSVVKETDYRPTANAGGDQIVYLPKTEITLNGNTSTDDHGIVEWEWTKGPKDSGKAVDMQDTRTPYLHLSNLEEGRYQFILRVTDATAQSSESSVYVYVKKPSMNVPKANAGEDLQLVLPNTTVILDGSRTTDITPNTHWLWKQISGPNSVHLRRNDDVKVNASGLTKGKYNFMLTTWNGDDPLKNSSDTVIVSVIQDKNVSPKANAGGDFSVSLPVSVIVVNGSLSSDDVAVTKWKWERDAASLAAGTVINGSDHSSILMFTDIVAGVYVWKLTVWDDQNASSFDTVSIKVIEGEHLLNEIELIIGGDIGTLSYSQESTLLQKLELLLHTTDHVTIHLITLTGIPHSGQVRLTFLAYAGKNVIRGKDVVKLLRRQITSQSSDLLDLPLISVDTVMCQNDCSGHGECIQATRECRCQTWWMESYIRRHMGDGIQNCDWSVVYVFVTICVIAITFGLCIWGIIILLVRKFEGNSRPRRKPPRYTLLDSQEENVKYKTQMSGSLLDSGSESDSDAEVLFDSRKTKQRNGYQKLARSYI